MRRTCSILTSSRVHERHCLSIGIRRGFSAAAAVFPTEQIFKGRVTGETRAKHLREDGVESYPRYRPSKSSKTCDQFNYLYRQFETDRKGDEITTIQARIHSIRRASSGLLFIDIAQHGNKVQCYVEKGKVCRTDETVEDFKRKVGVFRRGDIIRVRGKPFRTKQKGDLVLAAIEPPEMLAPSLQDFPERLEDLELKARNWHINHLTDRSLQATLALRSMIIRWLRNDLDLHGFREVETPILAGSAGGAAATPFETKATEFADWDVALRISPELWLKRLIISGIERVFEIGPSFRNEGLDRTHNAEFTTCEFYETYIDLDGLMTRTESMLSRLSGYVQSEKLNVDMSSLPPIPINIVAPFKRLQFIPTLEERLGRKLPILSDDSAIEELKAIVIERDLKLSETSTIPQLLDTLASHLIEQDLQDPTFLTHHPAIMSPLAKSFLDPDSNQKLSARAELFIGGRELANMYEEENDPAEQRRKFLEQNKILRGPKVLHPDETHSPDTAIDENYCKALETGMPPTGGWGCGIDRLVMLFSGAERIGHVRPFGNFRNVVGLSRESNK